MTCDKCENIHAAQLAGVTSNTCECECHDKSSHYVLNYIIATSDGEIESFTSCSVGGCETFKL